jgi:hypothetical protein
MRRAASWNLEKNNISRRCCRKSGILPRAAWIGVITTA